MSRKDRAPSKPYDGPQKAHLNLAGGGTIECSIAEDPQRNAEGMRVFLLSPARRPRPWETVSGAYIDRLPGRSVASIVWESKPLPEGTAMSMTWHDETGDHETTQPLGVPRHASGGNWDGHPS